MKIEIKVETQNPVDAARHLRLCAATLRHHGEGRHGCAEFSEELARSIEMAAEELHENRIASHAERLRAWGF